MTSFHISNPKKPAKVFYILQRLYVAACGNCGFQVERRDTDFQDAFEQITLQTFGVASDPEVLIEPGTEKNICRGCNADLEPFEEPEGPAVE